MFNPFKNITYCNPRKYIMISESDRKTCPHQKIESYPADDFTYCKFEGECNFKQNGKYGDVWCNKPILSVEDAAIGKVLTELTESFFNDPVGRKTTDCDEVELMDEILERIESFRPVK